LKKACNRDRWEGGGTVFATGIRPGRNPIEEQYLARTQQALSYAALGSAALALLLGIVLARSLTHPLRELTAAISAMAAGNLEQRVSVRSRDELGDLAAAFNQMSADLAHSNDLRRQMTADIAHDLRSPLTVIAGYLEALRDGVLTPTPARFEAMHAESQHLLRLVEDLRTLSLADAGELTLNRQAVSPLALLERLGRLTSTRLPTGRCSEVEAVGDLPDINVDAERMVQVLGNLISNALR
jgi:signal transduction histidine kinase